jgi:Zn-dependent M28 family amino/carboxypeptidase
MIMSLRMPGRSYRGRLAVLTSDERELSDRLAAHVGYLAGTIGERNVWRLPNLEWAGRYVANAWGEAGYRTQEQIFEAAGTRVRNLEVELPGGRRAAEIVVVGAHYDTVPGCPGANDNGSGIAAMVEIAGRLAGRSLARTIRFVAFANEEPPFFQTAEMGSLQYARRCRSRGETVVAMLSLETIGCYSDAPGSQRYPVPIGWFYPDAGNFIGFVANPASRRLLRQVVAAFRRHAAFPSEGAALPPWIPGVGWSDQWAFWQQGYPAVMVTDTAPFRYPHYHLASDTPDKLDYERTARVTAGLVQVVAEVAGA